MGCTWRVSSHPGDVQSPSCGSAQCAYRTFSTRMIRGRMVWRREGQDGRRGGGKGPVRVISPSNSLTWTWLLLPEATNRSKFLICALSCSIRNLLIERVFNITTSYVQLQGQVSFENLHQISWPKFLSKKCKIPNFSCDLVLPRLDFFHFEVIHHHKIGHLEEKLMSRFGGKCPPGLHWVQ